MKDKEKLFLYSICEEIMPNIPPRKKSAEAKSFALMIRSGESLAPSHVSEIGARTKLSPVFITFSQGAPLDVSRLYARALGAKLFLPRSAAAATEILNTCNFSICESEEYAIFSLSAKIPTYINASCPKCRNFAARLCASGTPPSVIVPYTKNRTEEISTLSPREADFEPTIVQLRNALNIQ